jgi:L-ascorbate metabolism protein UlaG (beta-lactamase superfamily)
LKVTLLGHASVCIEMLEARCLMDPVFSDPFEDTAVVSCPGRSIALDAIPRVDLLVVSHSHPHCHEPAEHVHPHGADLHHQHGHE